MAAAAVRCFPSLILIYRHQKILPVCSSFKRRLHSHHDNIIIKRKFRVSGPAVRQVARFTPQEVSEILRENQFTSGEFQAPGSGSVKSFDMNTLRSNEPIEDAHSEAVIKFNEAGGGMLFGIFDGHGGAACGQIVAKRLLHYVAAGLLNVDALREHLKVLENNDVGHEMYNLLKNFNDPFELVPDLQSIYAKSYTDYVRQTLTNAVTRMDYDEGISVAEVMINAFESLDNDMSREASDTEPVNMKTLTVAMSGSVAAVAHVSGPHLHVAGSGDCTAVLGSLSENDTWIAHKLTTDHNSDNAAEIKRILSEHPPSEHRDIIKKDRLLGILAPLRAFGDFKFKWPEERIVRTLGAVLGEHALPPSYKTPPYLSVTPEVSSWRLTPRDKFLVIASDGLWDTMTPMQVIRLVGEHMSGKITLSPLELIGESFRLDEINALLRHRQAAMKLKPVDSNAATHLIRCALGGTAYGVDHGRLSQMLSIPQDMVRMFRDDITVQVIFFDSEYLKHC